MARVAGAGIERRRNLYREIEASEGRHLVGIVGPRGAGKTVLLKQMAAAQADAVYISVDTLERETDLFEVVKEMVEHYRFTTFLLDEVHYLPGVNGFLKRIYDFLQVRVIFTSSVALEMEGSAHDLSRRVRLYRLDYFSFREYLEFRHGERLERLGLDDLLAGNIPAAHLRAGSHFVKYISGGLLPFSIEEPEPLPLLSGTLEKIIERDIPKTMRLHLDEIDLLRKMLRFISRSSVDGINYSTLSANLGITKYKAEQYAAAFESAFVLQRIFPAGMNVVREPKVLLVPPARLLERPLDEVIGALREEFFALAMRQAGLELRYLKSTRGQKTPDFLLVHKGERIAMEIGGKGKGRSQFKGVIADRKIVLGQDIAPAPGRLPLHLAGFLV